MWVVLWAALTSHYIYEQHVGGTLGTRWWAQDAGENTHRLETTCCTSGRNSSDWKL